MKETYGELLKKTKIGKMTLKNHVVMSPMDFKFVSGNYSDSTISERAVETYRARAKGGVGLIITSHVKAEQKLDPFPKSLLFPIIDRDERIKEFAALADAVHIYGSKIAAELSPGSGRYADYIEEGDQVISASAVVTQYDTNLYTREMTISEIDYLVDCYGKAASRLQQAGFDAICVHCSCGYLMGQFLSPAWNHREDEYGGSIENRMRFLIRCIEAVKESCGKDMPIILSFTIDEKLNSINAGVLTTGEVLEEGALDFESNGMDVEYAGKVAGILEKKEYVDAYHVRIGNYYNQEHIIPSAYSTNDEYREAFIKFKSCVTKPVIWDNKLNDPGEMGKMIETGVTDFVSQGRGWIAEPEWCNKAASSPEDIRPCIRCMMCLDKLWNSKYAACAVNPQFGHEYEKVFPAVINKKVLVVGGGPAGIQAAITASQRGHNVTLVEASERLGGRLYEAGSVTYKSEIIKYAKYLNNAIGKSNVKVKLNTKADAGYIKDFSADVVFIANGAKEVCLKISGAEKASDFKDILLEKVQTGNKVAVIGGGLIGCETAYKLYEQGKQVTIFEQQDDILKTTSIVYRHAAVSKLQNTNIEIRTGVNVTEIKENKVIFDQNKELEVDDIVFAVGLKSDDILFDEIYGNASEVYTIGDARQPRKIFEAVHEAYQISKEL